MKAAVNFTSLLWCHSGFDASPPQKKNQIKIINPNLNGSESKKGIKRNKMTVYSTPTL